jgi:hypothetical protein
MTRTMWLLTEDVSTYKVIQALFRAKGYAEVQIKLRGSARDLSTLAKEIRALLKEAKRLKHRNDCIVAIHDADLLVRLDRKSYDDIKRVCELEENQDVLYVLAHDEIESWLLADAGLCKWLGEKPRNRDEERQPSLILNSLLKARKGKVRWNERYQDEILKWVDGTGDAPNRSPSMRSAFEQLVELSCMQE